MVDEGRESYTGDERCEVYQSRGGEIILTNESSGEMEGSGEEEKAKETLRWGF